MMNTLPTTASAYHLRLYPNAWDLLALLFVLSLLALLAWTAQQMAAPYHLGQVITISLSPAVLAAYAARTVIRMFIALWFSLLFTFIFGTWAAKIPRAGKIIIPIIDMLQSVPILGFLSITIVGFIRLFPGSLLGPECAAIFAIFTSQAWNMVLGFYQTIRSVPADINEAARMLHLSAWQRFWCIDVPFSMPGLLWNMMISMSSGWFFVIASEAITVSNQQILLPGIGSYLATAIKQTNLAAICYAIAAMFVVILLYDQLLFRPLVAWAEKFKTEQVGSEKVPESWVIDVFRRTRIMRLLGNGIAYLFDFLVNIKPFWHQPVATAHQPRRLSKWIPYTGYLWSTILILGLLSVAYYLIGDALQHLSRQEISRVFFLGLITALRVFVMIVICSLLWIPVGVWIGQHATFSQWIQPLVQFLAAFPANILYPFIVVLIVKYHLNSNIWLTPLMILGAQWYVLFNVIVGASTIPKDLLQVADNFNVHGPLRWVRLLLPGIFPYYITGALAASGGAWNASIVSEVVSWGDTQLKATGLGAYIAHYTTTGDFPRIALGISMMCFFVWLFNYFIWRPLYRYTENRFSYLS